MVTTLGYFHYATESKANGDVQVVPGNVYLFAIPKTTVPALLENLFALLSIILIGRFLNYTNDYL